MKEAERACLLDDDYLMPTRLKACGVNLPSFKGLLKSYILVSLSNPIAKYRREFKS
jgi:hypothetical protein